MSSVLNIVSTYVDNDMQAIRDRLAGHHSPAGDASDVKTILADLAGQQKQFGTLNLIGHSNEDHFLMIGDPDRGGWILNRDAPDRFRSVYAESLRTLGVSTIRILGCSTATRSGAWQVIHGIVNSLAIANVGVVGVGTRRLIHEPDYSTDDFAKASALVSTTEVTSNSTPKEEDTKKVSHGVPDAGFAVGALDVDALAIGERSELRQTLLARLSTVLTTGTDLWRLIDTARGWSLPGLQAATRNELLLPVFDRDHLHRVQVLLDCEFVRVFLDRRDGRYGVVYRVLDPGALRVLIATEQRNPISKL